MGLIKYAYKAARIAVIATAIYATSMYIANKYAESYTEGRAHPVAGTIEKIGDDAGDAVKQVGRCAARATESGIEKAIKIDEHFDSKPSQTINKIDEWYIKTFFDPHYEHENSKK